YVYFCWFIKISLVDESIVCHLLNFCPGQRFLSLMILKDQKFDLPRFTSFLNKKKPHIVAVIVEQELTARKSGNKRLFFFRFVSFFHEIHDKSKRHVHNVVYVHAIFH